MQDYRQKERNHMIQELTIHNFDVEIRKDRPVVVELYTTNCNHCKKLSGILDKLSQEAEDAHAKIWNEFNVDTETVIQQRFDVTAVPTLLFIKDGEVKNRLIGEVHPLVIQEEIKKLR